ncbi:DegT/DnrJ/EryC1/StrS family aminotransferase [Desulfolutivibrio sulfoxidireducens]|nr:DegT/DnrJ/EryC1/StrS family aminotransferase [Desulfolutivibrio sulfoxidireducens]
MPRSADATPSRGTSPSRKWSATTPWSKGCSTAAPRKRNQASRAGAQGARRRASPTKQRCDLKNTWRFDEKELEYIQEVLQSDFMSSTVGNMNQRFEKAYAAKCGARYAVSMNSGTSTMHACLAAVGVGPGDEVIVPALTVISTASVVLHQNAVPVFADIDPETFTIDPDDVRKKITPRTRAIIPVSLYGLCCDFDPILELAAEHGLTVIEDAAQAHMAGYKGRTSGAICHMTSVSFENSKHITTGDGGMVTTDDERLAVAVRKFATLGYAGLRADDGRVRKILKDELQSPGYERHDGFGWNYRMPEVAAAVGLAQVEKMDRFVAMRQKIAAMYAAVIREEGCGFLIPQKNPEGHENTYFTFAARFDAAKAGRSWRDFRDLYKRYGGDGIYAAWLPVYLEPVMREYRFYGKGCPVRCPLYAGHVEYARGLCPVTEEVQPTLMQFVNNYRDEQEAAPKVEALRQAIRECGK